MNTNTASAVELYRESTQADIEAKDLFIQARAKAEYSARMAALAEIAGERERKGSITEGVGGRRYGTWQVFLVTEFECHIGTRMGPFGGIQAKHGENRYKEAPDKWWVEQGYTIIDPLIEKVRATHR